MATTYLTKTLGTPTENKKWTLSVWCKRSSLAAVQTIFSAGASSTDTMSFSSSGIFNFYVNAGNSGRFASNRLFRDTSSWYNVILAADSTQSTAANRMKLYINGVQETSFSNATYPSVNYSWKINSAVNHSFGGYSESSSGDFWDGSMSYVSFVDGTQELPGIFGETDSTTGEWKIKTTITPSVAWGNNGFLILKNGNSLTDESSNSNNFTLAGGTLTNTEDCPSNVFATINPLNYQLSGCTLANGNTSLTATGGNGWRTFYGTLAGSSGKFYWEQKVNSYSGSSHYIGISDIDESRNVNTNDFENGGVSAYCYRADGGKVTSVSGSTVLTAGVGASFGAGDIIGIAMDLDNQKIYFSKNGTWQNSGDPTSGATGTGSFFDITAGKLYTPATATYNTSNQFFSYNFGNGTFGTTDVSSAGTAGSTPGVFEYDVPTGYEPMTTKGLNV